MSDFDQRNHDFCKSLADAQFAYIEAEKRVSELQDENAKLREELESVGTAAYLYGRDDLKAENEKLKAENAELVRVLHELEQEAIHAYRCLQHDCEHFLEGEQYFFKKWWSSDCENDKLRKKARELWHGHDCGGGCVYFDKCDHPIKDECPMIDSLRELGIEVGE